MPDKELDDGLSPAERLVGDVVVEREGGDEVDYFTSIPQSEVDAYNEAQEEMAPPTWGYGTEHEEDK